MASKHKGAVPDSARSNGPGATRIKHPSVPRSPSQGRTSAKGTGSAPVGPLQRIPKAVRTPGNGANQYKGG